MTAATAGPTEPDHPPFAAASPARIRDALTAEDALAFDRHWPTLMQRATGRLDLTELHDALEGWRRVAWVTSTHGPEIYRETLASGPGSVTDRRSRRGSGPMGAARAELGLPE